MISQITLISQYQSLATQIKRSSETKERIMQLEAENRALKQELSAMRTRMQKLVHEILTIRRMVCYAVWANYWRVTNFFEGAVPAGEQ